MERSKDTMLLFKSVKKDVNDKGKLRVQLSMSPDQLKALIAELSKHVAAPRGAKIDMHVSKKTYEGREFDSGIAFVKEIQEFGALAPRKFASAPTKGYVTADAVKQAKASVTKQVE